MRTQREGIVRVCVHVHAERSLSLFPMHAQRQGVAYVCAYAQRGISLCFYVSIERRFSLFLRTRKEKPLPDFTYTKIRARLCVWACTHGGHSLYFCRCTQRICVACLRMYTHRQVSFCFYAHAKRRSCVCLCMCTERNRFVC